ncbi:MAG: hypothetical protein NTU47_14140 [Ignavibacteriales bacterium]|nr:hypothetical protein [Ignavibacteriales bacterium]
MKKVMKQCRRILPVILMLGSSMAVPAQTLINPGLKLGYRFGEGGGFVGGFEISIMFWNEKGYYGFVLAGDGTSKTLDYHFGVEYGIGYFGICVGPVVSHRSDTTTYGLRVTPYGGFILVPYYNYQFLVRSGSEHEVGTYFKLTIPNSQGGMGRIGG